MSDVTDSIRPALHALDGDEAVLHAELLGLNEELRELKSTDHTARAYFLSWFALVTVSVTTKLLIDWFVPDPNKPEHHFPALAVPIGLAAVWAMAKSFSHRAKARRMERHEAVRMSRQLELRRRLGLEEAVFPLSEPMPAREVA
ncbi:MAG: hypothetical protein RL199_2110 [Pseudomonadota bacterium]|jgi:hypothetical protein